MSQGSTRGVPIDTDTSLTANSDLLVASQKATKAYVDAAVASGVADGDKGDITVSGGGTTYTIDNGVVTAAKTSITGTPTGSKYLRDDWSWQTVSGGSGITELTGDVTAGPGSGAQAATIANDAVTNAKLRNSGALSVIGRSANSTGDPADISAVAASDSVLRESGSTIGFGTIATGGIANSAVTLAKIANAAANSKLVGSGSAGSGAAYSEITLGTGLSMSGTTLNVSAATGVTRVDKTSNETTASDTTLSDDAAITFAVAANTKYKFRFGFQWDTPAAADFKFAFTCPTSPTLFIVHGHRILTSGSGAGFMFTASGDTESITGATSVGSCFGEGILHNGANIGNVTLQWAQVTSNASNTTVYAGAYIEYWTVA